MPSGHQRDLGDVERALGEWLRARHADRTDLELDSLRHASAGLANETVLVTSSWMQGADRQAEALAIRLPAVESTFADCRSPHAGSRRARA
jgi:hypothetical protein